MEIGNARIISHEDCMRRNLCIYCKEPGHQQADYRKRQARNNLLRPQGRNSFRCTQRSFRRVVDDDDVSDDDDDFVERSYDHVEVIDSFQQNMVSVDSEEPTKRELLRFKGLMNGHMVRVLIDSGADRNIWPRSIAQHYVDAKVTAERFDDTTTHARTAQRCCETLNFDGRDFTDVSLIEWEGSANQDVILGHSSLVRFNPIIN